MCSPSHTLRKIRKVYEFAKFAIFLQLVRFRDKLLKAVILFVDPSCTFFIFACSWAGSGNHNENQAKLAMPLSSCRVYTLKRLRAILR